MSLKAEAWVDHPTDGDRHERNAAQNHTRMSFRPDEPTTRVRSEVNIRQCDAEDSISGLSTWR
jgi:hypothetical protein